MTKFKNLNILGIKEFTIENSDIYVNTISNHLETSHLHINKPHKHNFFAAFFFTQGSGNHEIDFNSYEVKPNSIFLLSPGQTHTWQLSDDVEGIIFFHSQEFYEARYLHDFLSDYAFFSNVQNQADLYLDRHMSSEMIFLFQKLHAINSLDCIKKNQLLLSLVTQIYIGLENGLGSSALGDVNKHDRYYIKFLKFQRLVEENFITEKSVERYADWMNVTAKHLSRINRAIIGKSTLEIIMDRTILEAKRDLIFGNKNISQVAEDLGYSDSSHFSKIFKNKTGKTPSQFLKLYL